MSRIFGDGLVYSFYIDVLVEGDELLGEIFLFFFILEIYEIVKLIVDNLVEDGVII